ncbi:MAG: LysR family transcriptional regulator [Deltaproteobacteria bacterium]|jgi:DNA-binding transcriptional LysR family regulator|nr:LysR family transcriptional regulator [Deltaproteobacteria bacterium]
MSIFAFRVFVAVIENSSFVKAADVVHITASAVSHSIAKLEDDLGLRLFTRNRLGAQPTADAESIYPHVLSVLNSYERLTQEISQLKGLTTGTVRIAVFHSVCMNWIPDIVKTFKESHPLVEINVSQGNYYDVLGWLSSGYSDLGFISLTLNTKGLDCVSLFRDRLVCVTPKDYRPANNYYMTIDDILANKIIWQQSGDDLEVLAMLSGKSRSILHNRPTVQYDHAIIALAEAGLGIGILPELVLKGISHNAAVFPVDPPWYRTIAVATPSDRPRSHATVAMEAHIIDYCAKHFGELPKD